MVNTKIRLIIFFAAEDGEALQSAKIKNGSWLWLVKFKFKRKKTGKITKAFSSVQSPSHLWLCDSMDWSTPGLPAHHQLPEFTQTHVHWVGDTVLPSHPLSSLSPAAFYLSQHQDLFQGVNSSYQVATIWEFQLQHHFLRMNIQDWYPLGWISWISLQL